jgi:hypothetical protein
MKRRRPIGVTAAALAFALLLSAPAGAVSTPKKGVGTWSFTGESQAMSSVGATWFYTWSTSASGNTVPSTVAFVPMIWGSASVTTANLNAVKAEGSVLLGFNEPDQSGQSNLTPAQAIALWPQLVATGMRLGSPAVSANAQQAGGWLDTFMTSANAMNLPVDFICLHWYGGNFDPTSAVSELSSYIEQTHAKFGLPIWVTEFALTNFSGGVSYPTEAEQAAFAGAAVDMLESTSYVERYAWFALPPCDATGSSSCAAGNTRPLALDGGALTSVGVAYAGAGPDGGTLETEAGAPDGGAGSATGDAGSGTGSTGGEDAAAGVDATVGSSEDAAVGLSGDGGGATGSGDAGPSHASSSSGGGCSCETALGDRDATPGGGIALGCALGALVVCSSRRARKRPVSPAAGPVASRASSRRCGSRIPRPRPARGAPCSRS